MIIVIIIIVVGSENNRIDLIDNVIWVLGENCPGEVVKARKRGFEPSHMWQEHNGGVIGN